MSSEQIISIIDRQQVQWFLASENLPCNIVVKYRSHGTEQSGYSIISKRKCFYS